MKKLIVRGAILILVLAAAWGGYRLFKQLPERQQQIATTRVRQSDVVIRTFARGELRAVRSAMLIAPNLFGTVQVTRLAPLGSFSREKDLIVEFDDSEVRSRLEEKQLEVEQDDEQIKKNEADLAIRDNQDQVELLRTGYSVRRSELDVKRNELFSAIDAQKNILNLQEAQRRLKQLQSDIKSRQEQARAQLDVLKQNKNRALIELQRERNRLMQVKLLAPMSGLVAIRQSRPMGGYFPGMQLPDIREGDQVYPGTPIADILDLSELEVAAKVGELDRANLHEGQDVLIALDAVAGKTFHGEIKSMSGTASANVWSGDPAKKFDVVCSVDMKELLTGLGARPEQIRRVLETAEQNRKKPAMLASMSPMMASGSGGMPQAGAPGGEPAVGMGGLAAPEGGGTQGGQREARSGREGGGRRGGMFGGAQMSEADRQKFRQALEKELGGKSMRDLSPEERQKVFAKLQEKLKLPGQPGAGRPAQAAKPSEAAKAGGMAGALTMAGALAPGGGRLPSGFGMGAATRFSEKDLENADLPPPPEASSQLDVLLRPGLLADVEIIVEKIPNAIHIPAQGVFETEGKLVAYVKVGNTFEPRVIRPLKRSESTIVVAEGLKPGEIIALADPTAKQGAKKQEKQGGGSGRGSLPVGGAKGGK